MSPDPLPVQRKSLPVRHWTQTRFDLTKCVSVVREREAYDRAKAADSNGGEIEYSFNYATSHEPGRD
jgi:hypothetical protein